jgi:hypothetical protein
MASGLIQSEHKNPSGSPHRLLISFAAIDLTGCTAVNFVAWDEGLDSVRLAEIEGSQVYPE